MIKLNIQFASGITKLDLRPVQKAISALENIESTKIPPNAVINVRIMDQAKVREYNRRYSGHDEATDVLSFNYDQVHPRANEELGDIVISFQHVINQAKQAGTDDGTELALLTLHGILHILGYDHADKKQQKKLDELQEDIMSQAGLECRKFDWKQ
jgi:probable rRNA maturation factor